MRKYTIILNPIAGKGHAVKYIPLIEDFFKKNNINGRIILTVRPGHAVSLAEESAEDPDNVIVAAGGDGTCNEVINGLMGFAGKTKRDRKPVFSVLPVGRGNDFSYGVDMSGSPEECLNIIIKAEPVPLDTGRVIGGYYPQGRYFGNGVGVGFDTIVGLEAAKMKHVHGGIAYLLGAVKTFIKYPDPPMVKLTAGGRTLEVMADMISLMNGKRMGGSFYMAPDSSYNDGLLNLCLSPHMKRGKQMKTFVRYMKGTQGSLPDIITMKAPSYTLEALQGGLVVHADGETICIDGKHLEIQCIPHALNIINKSGL